jgi:Uma2 family endonuclease
MALVATIAQAHEAPLADEPLMRLTLEDYHALIRMGFFEGREASYELLDGYLIKKMSKKPARNYCQIRLMSWLARNAPTGYVAGQKVSLTLGQSEPEPDGVVVKDLGDE